MKQYRAIYEPDPEKLIFHMKWSDKRNDMLFVSEDDPDCFYPIGIVFHDSDWIVEEEILLLDNSEPKRPIFVGDVLNSTKYPDEDRAPYEVVYSDGSYRHKPLNTDWPEGLPYPKLEQIDIDLLTDKIIGTIHDKEKS